MNAAQIRLVAGTFVAGIAVLTLTACNSAPSAAPTPAPTTSTSTATPSTQLPAPQAPAQVNVPAAPKPKSPEVIGPRSFGKVTLGMTYADAKAAGLIGKKTASESVCADYPMLGKGGGGAVFSPNQVVVAIILAKNVRTPEGVAIGWTAAKVKKVYPDLSLNTVQNLHRALVPVPGNATAHYRLGFDDGVVSSITLQSAEQNCYE